MKTGFDKTYNGWYAIKLNQTKLNISCSVFSVLDDLWTNWIPLITAIHDDAGTSVVVGRADPIYNYLYISWFDS